MTVLRWKATVPCYNGDRPWLRPTRWNASVSGFGTYGFGNSRWPLLARIKALWNLALGRWCWWS